MAYEIQGLGAFGHGCLREIADPDGKRIVPR